MRHPSEARKYCLAETLIETALGRLNEVGVDDTFGVAGDYAFPVNDAIVEHPAINWVGCCNELNAARAADGYARMRGVGAVCTIYGVGELAAMSAIAGTCAEHLAVFHLVGIPNLPTQEGGRWFFAAPIRPASVAPYRQVVPRRIDFVATSSSYLFVLSKRTRTPLNRFPEDQSMTRSLSSRSAMTGEPGNRLWTWALGV